MRMDAEHLLFKVALPHRMTHRTPRNQHPYRTSHFHIYHNTFSFGVPPYTAPILP